MEMSSPGRRPSLGRLLCASALCLSACAGLPQAEHLGGAIGDERDRVELADVPFYPQRQFECGPAALAMVLTHAGASHSPAELADQVFLPQRKGALQPEMLAATRRAGLIAYPLAPDFDVLIQEIQGGHPVVVLLNQRYDFLPQWHYAVLIGYDRNRDEVFLRSGNDMRLTMKWHEFERAWQSAGRWAFVAMPPGQMPATANESAYVAASIDLERVSPHAAQSAYATTLAKWPTDLVARLGLGNSAYAQHNLAQAEQEYRQAVIDHPDAADAWNNLAQVLHELKRDGPALEAADRAVAIGGTREKTYASTQSMIRSDGHPCVDIQPGAPHCSGIEN